MRYLVLLLLSSCAYQHVIELGAGYDSHISVGSNPQSVIRYRLETANIVYEYNHHSSITDGYPFNHRDDDVTNQWSIIWRYVF